MFEENWESVLMFLRLTTQWTTSSGGFLGLNYQSVEFLFRTYRVKNKKDMLEDLQVMELAALSLLNKKE